MLSYRHIYHAGNFADVFKHVVLLQLLRALLRKDAPFFVLDTHAGIGRYELALAEAQRNREFSGGVARLLECADPPPAISDYLAQVYAQNPVGSELVYYPGSPCLIRALLRAQDRLVLSELHPTDVVELKRVFAGDKQVAVHQLDGYQGLKAFLPPLERRGLVLIDPPYERKDEYARVVANLHAAHQRWPSGTYMVWYPILSRSLVNRLHQAVIATGIRKVLCAELCIDADTDRSAFVGSGLLIVNPPWQLQEQLVAQLSWLWQCLAPAGQGRQVVEWLVPE